VIPLAFVSDQRLDASFCKIERYMPRKSRLPISIPLWRRIA
jgi:hypothetical protein